MKEVIISAKNLGGFAVPDACERCLWIGLHCKLPYQIFPGIFSSIDSYTKKVVHGFFQRTGTVPSWLQPLGEVVQYIEPPSYHRFEVLDKKTGVVLRGEADGIFHMRDKTYTIVDYKTAKYTTDQEDMMPVYETQLNAYAYIGERNALSPVGRLALVYMEPVTDNDTAAKPRAVSKLGFRMEMTATIVDVENRADKLIPPLLRRVRRVFDMLACPPEGQGCKDCATLAELAQLIT